MRNSTDLLASGTSENYFKKFKVSGNGPTCIQQMKEHLFKKIYWASIRTMSLPLPSQLSNMETLDCCNQGHRLSFSLSSQLKDCLSRWGISYPAPSSLLLQLSSGWVWPRAGNYFCLVPTHGTEALTWVQHCWEFWDPNCPRPQLVMEPCWERQGKKTWGYSSPPLRVQLLKRGYRSGKHAISLMPAPEPWLRDFCLEVEINCSTESAKSFPKATTSFAPQSGLVQNKSIWKMPIGRPQWKAIGRRLVESLEI